MKKPTISPDLPQGTLDMLILKVVASGPIHGYAIAQRIQQISREVLQVTQGSLYPDLHRLEHRKLLQSDWKSAETGREAKYYRLTRKGRTELQSEALNWDQLRDAIQLIMRDTADGSLRLGNAANTNLTRNYAFTWK